VALNQQTAQKLVKTAFGPDFQVEFFSAKLQLAVVFISYSV
jgi:hypothetical protein